MTVALMRYCPTEEGAVKLTSWLIAWMNSREEEEEEDDEADWIGPYTVCRLESRNLEAQSRNNEAANLRDLNKLHAPPGSNNSRP